MATAQSLAYPGEDRPAFVKHWTAAIEALCIHVHNETVEKCSDRMAEANMPGMADYLRKFKLKE
jgi:hypothetical protein